MGEQGASRVKIKHSANSLNRVQEVRDSLGIIHAVADDFSQAVAELCQQEVSNNQWRDFLLKFAPDDVNASDRSRNMAQGKRDTLQKLWLHDERVSPWANTAYGVVAAVNTYTHHEQHVRGASRAERNAERAINGGVDALDNGTLQLLATVM